MIVVGVVVEEDEDEGVEVGGRLPRSESLKLRGTELVSDVVRMLVVLVLEGSGEA